MEEILKLSQGLKVLYVEDNEQARESMVGLLHNLFNEVVVAVDGQDGLEKFFQNGKIDLIITDINMPRLNGLDLIDKIREKDNNVSILVLSAHSEPSYFSKSSKKDIDGYLYKPLESKQFIEAITKVVKKAAS